MSIDYSRRGPKRKAQPDPVPDPPRPWPDDPDLEADAAADAEAEEAEEAARPKPGGKPQPKPDVPELPRGSWAGFGLRLTLIGFGYAVATHGAPVLGWTLVALAVLSYWRARQPIRYLAAWAGLAVLRAYVVRKTGPYRDQLGDMGAVRDPDALWMQILQSRCGTCGA